MVNSYSYDAYGRLILRQLTTTGTAQAVSGIAYDVKGRVASVGNGADTLHYAYRPGLDRLATATWRNSQNAELNSRTYAYDTYHRLTGINLNNVSEVTYTLNAKDQRTAASYAVGGAWSYSYDEKSQVTGATGNNTTYSYTYDGIGNRLTAAEGSNTWSYTSNLVNQYTQIASQVPTYDADGNMTSYNGWTYTWNGENRLIRAENSDTLVEMAYDYMGRRIEKKVSSKGVLSFYSWSLEKHYKFAYDGYKLIAIYDAANNNALLMTFTWQPESVGLDVPVSMTCDGNTYYYVMDGNKNVTGLLDQAGTRVAEYVYGPFGQLLSAEGELADVNPFRFSSEYADDETGLIYYNYRNYSPQLGRWIKRDPIEEQGGVNLYAYLFNDYINLFDNIGLGIFTVKKKIIDLTASGISVEAMTSGNPNGFSVDWTPSKADEAACKCGSFSLSQAISSNGLGGYSAHVDASKAERRANRNSGYNNPPPTMTPHGDSKYSYIDSPSAPQGPWPVYTTKFTLTAVAICIPKNNPQKWFVVDSITFTFIAPTV